ncbi:variant erythrocyte surface antigen-1 family protein [Babesia caballi]|uniref:Variant erythrocyte surface antigen-1 family protein n=1 Tax=Babesia caballi TaxID=5871 RepID=A0AAV4LY71_BABCB|nr:variant erythrocyte surface antigen-1 family protein [Babesia caballi]
MTSGGKSLTQPPKDLKEAIDWVIKTLNVALPNLLEVPVKNEGFLVKSIDAIKLRDRNPCPITAVATGLQKFVGYKFVKDKNKSTYTISIDGNGIVNSGTIHTVNDKSQPPLQPPPSNFTYTTAYPGSWSSDVTSSADAHTKALESFFTAIQHIYEGLTELYLKCETEWKTENLGGNGGGTDLKQFMYQNGFSGTQLNPQMTGEQITTQALKGLSEFTTAYIAAGPNTSLDAFRSQLEQNGMSSPSTFPLSALYILATYVALRYSFIRPCRPLLDSPSNLKEAIKSILRVTGKDGGNSGVGSGNEEKLAKAVVNLPDFQQAIKAAVEKLKESGGVDVSQALAMLNDAGTLENIITKLAEGLKAFIGYGGGKGIADLVDPLQQLRKGLLMFLQMMLEKLRGYINNDSDIIGELNKAYMGRVNFESAIDKVGNIKDGDQKKIPTVVSASQNTEQLKQNKDDRNKFPEAVSNYLKGVLEAVEKKAPQAMSQVDTLKGRLESLIRAYGKQEELVTLTNEVKDANAKLDSNKSRDYPARPLIEGVKMGTTNLLTQLKTGGYKSSYLGSDWNGDTSTDKISQIFLGCLPLYYYWLTYLYWKCREGGGDWATQRLSGAGGTTLMISMLGQGYVRGHLNNDNKNGMGSNIAKTALAGFTEFPTAVLSAKSYAEFLQKLRDTGIEKWSQGTSQPPSTTSQNHCLSGLYILTSTYFGHQQRLNAKDSRPPTSIREMLYWLSGLQFSPNYNELKKEIEIHIPEEGLRVADSSKPSTSGSSGPGSPSTSDNITRIDFNDYLTSSCVFAPALLATIQGNSADSKEQNGEPWLHSLFSNSEFKLNYPSSGAALFNTLANYAYALQFQLSFLYMQCVNGSSDGFGWNQCTFGQHINTQNLGSATDVSSWICSSPACANSNRCQHNSSTCQHYSQCGQTNKQSPLQAFLTDNLKGFYVSQQSDPDSPHHLDNHPPGSMCHVPMGFADKLRRDLGGGANIVYALALFFGTSNDPLRQLSEKLGCLTKRAPKTLGDLFGFLWRLNSQMFKSRPTPEELIGKFGNAFGVGDRLASEFTDHRYAVITKIWKKISQLTSQPSSSSSSTATVLSRSLESMAPEIPFLYQLFMMDNSTFLPGALFDLTQHCHKKESSNVLHNSSGGTCALANDLWSLYQPITEPSKNQKDCAGGNCGGYLSPLTHTFGSAFAPKHASSYFSWVLYLVDDLETELRGLLDEFRNVECPSNSLSTHDHDPSGNCSCQSVVHCDGVLPLLYANGFTFANAYSLKNPQTKRSCRQFHDQLSAVLAQSENAPLFKLLITIDDFLYMFRIYFFYNLSTFWIMYVCIVLYIYFLRADLLHLKSHVRFPSSHDIPSIGLLTTGKPTVMTKFTKLTYFTP